MFLNLIKSKSVKDHLTSVCTFFNSNVTFIFCRLGNMWKRQDLGIVVLLLWITETTGILFPPFTEKVDCPASMQGKFIRHILVTDSRISTNGLLKIRSILP